MQPCMTQREQHSKERCCNVMIKGTIEMYELIMPDFTFFCDILALTLFLPTLLWLSSWFYLAVFSWREPVNHCKEKLPKEKQPFHEGRFWGRNYFSPDFDGKEKLCLVWKTMHILHFLVSKKNKRSSSQRIYETHQHCLTSLRGKQNRK